MGRSRDVLAVAISCSLYLRPSRMLVSTTHANQESSRKSQLKCPLIMNVSFKGHNEEALWRPVDKKKLVDMLENNSKTRQKQGSKLVP
jgi:hypothetical protein